MSLEFMQAVQFLVQRYLKHRYVLQLYMVPLFSCSDLQLFSCNSVPLRWAELGGKLEEVVRSRAVQQAIERASPGSGAAQARSVVTK